MRLPKQLLKLCSQRTELKDPRREAEETTVANVEAQATEKTYVRPAEAGNG